MARLPFVLLTLGLCLFCAVVSEPIYSNLQLTNKVINLQGSLSEVEMRTLPTAGLEFLNTGYALAFRGSAGIGASAYAAYTNVGYNDDRPLVRLGVPCSCLSFGKGCNRHYRSSLLDAWPSEIIDKVRISWYVDNDEKQYIEFNGHMTTYLSWFSASKITRSSWTDVKTTSHNFFSIAGHVSVTLDRRFFINHHYGGCPNDIGWSVTLDKEDPCSWGKGMGSYPQFLYSELSTKTNWNTGANVGKADALVISVKFFSSPSKCSSCRM